MPAAPLLASRSSALLAVCSARAELLGKPEEELPDVLPDEPAVLLVPADEAADEADVGGLEGVEAGVGENWLFPTPKPIAEANVPPTSTESELYCPVSTRLPLLLSDALTCALPKTLALMAPIKSLTVSVPFVV